jgi:hypothetical protein
MQARVATLEAKLAEAEADKARLDWIEGNVVPVVDARYGHEVWIYGYRVIERQLKWAHASGAPGQEVTLRAAIDAAREGE